MNTITMKISGLLCFSGCLFAGEATIWEKLSNQTDQSIQQTYDRISECICFNTKKIKVVVELKNMPEFQNTQFTTTKIIIETHDFNCKYNGKLYRIASIDDVYSVDELIAPYLSEDNLDIVSFSPNDDDLMYFIISNYEGRKVLKKIVYFTLDELECSGG